MNAQGGNDTPPVARCFSPRSEPEVRAEAPHYPTRPSRLWLWIVAAFVLQALAWTAWFTIASLHPVEEVPVATHRAR